MTSSTKQVSDRVRRLAAIFALAHRAAFGTTRLTTRIVYTGRVVVGVALVVAASLAATSLARGGLTIRRQVVSCDEAISSFTGRPDPGRIILGRVRLRPKGARYLAAGEPRNSGPLPYFAKYGMVIYSGKENVDLSVPAAWRGRFRLGWGLNGERQFDAVRFLGCKAPPRWQPYAGGFYVRRPARVPLDIRIGARSRRVWLDIDAERAGSASDTWVFILVGGASALAAGAVALVLLRRSRSGMRLSTHA